MTVDDGKKSHFVIVAGFENAMQLSDGDQAFLVKVEHKQHRCFFAFEGRKLMFFAVEPLWIVQCRSSVAGGGSKKCGVQDEQQQ